MVEESVPSSTFLQTESRRNSSSSAENEEMWMRRQLRPSIKKDDLIRFDWDCRQRRHIKILITLT